MADPPKLNGFNPKAEAWTPVKAAYQSKYVRECKLGRVFAHVSGTVVHLAEDESETVAVVQLTVDEARAIASAFSAAARAAEERIEVLAGRSKWTVVERDGERILVSHAPWPKHIVKRWFRPMIIGKPRPRPSGGCWTLDGTPIKVHHGPHCVSCRKELHAGDAAYREAEPEGWANPNWRDVRLCRECVETSAAPEGTVSIFAARARKSRP